MSANATANEIDDFLNGALITWLESCLVRPETLNGYQSLFDASLFHTVWRNIDPEPQFYPQPLTDLDDAAIPIVRAKNFDNVIRNMRALYEEELGQTILVVPDCMVLGHAPESKAGLEQMKLLFTLLLGAAVQCPNKQFFIARIKELEVETQHAIVDIIKSVTDSQTLVLNADTLDNERRYTNVDHWVELVVRIARERDKYHTDWMTQVTPTAGDAKFTASETTVNQPAAINSDQNHLAVELADLKSKMRKLRQDLDEKTDSFLQAKEELEHKNGQYEKLRRETQEWYTESCRAAAYRDEVDVLRERADRADQLELEMQRMREKLSDADFFKTRVEELREDNRMLQKTKDMLEDQLTQSRKRFEQSMTLESEIIKYKQKLNDMALERDADREKLQELLDENTQLQLAMKSLNKPTDVDKLKSEEHDSDVPAGDNSLSEQLTNNAQTRAIKLELENRRLQQALDAMRETNFQENANKILDLEKEKKMLQLKLDQLQENTNRFTQQNQELEEMFKNALEENKKLQDAIDNRQEASEKQMQDKELDRMKLMGLEKQVETLTKEKQRIQNLSVSIQRRADDLERFLDTKKKELESIAPKAAACDRFEIETLDLKEKINAMEKENANLSKDLNKFKETLETKEVQLDENSAQLLLQSNEIDILRKQLGSAQNECNKIQDLESKNSENVTQLKMKDETLSTLQNDLIAKNVLISKIQKDLEKLNINWPLSEEEMVDLSVENVIEKMMQNADNWKVLREIVGREGVVGDDGGAACILCQKNIDVAATEREADLVHQTEEVLSSVSAEWKAQCDQLAAANADLQSNNDSLNQDLIKLRVDISTLSSQITSLNTQHIALQLANSQLATEKDAILKNKDTIELQNQTLLADQNQLQTLHNQLSVEYESLNKEYQKLKESLRDARHDNRNLNDQEQNYKQQVSDLQAKLLTTKKEIDAYINLRSEHSKLKDDFRTLFATNDRVKNEYKSIQEQHKLIRAENARLTVQNTELSGDLSEHKDHVKTLEINLTKESNRCEMLVQMNANLDVDRRSLMDHVSQLLSQYHELLGHSLDDKQHYHDEEKIHTDKVNNLYRQKEKLEEKIMEFYRNIEHNQKKKTFGSVVLKRVKKAGSDLMNKVPTKSNRRTWQDDSRLTQTQFGFESAGNESDNSGDEPHSTASDTNLLKKESQITIQRKSTVDLNDRVSSPGNNYLPLIRDEIRTSRNAIPGRLEAPDVTGSSLTLGAAGSRRTVYLVDENPKLPDTTGQSPDSELGQQHSSSRNNISNNNSSSSSNNNNHSSSSHDQSPSMVLMYNRISNVIGDPKVTQSPNNSINDSNASNGNVKRDKDNPEDHIWFEYGCV